MQLLCSHKPKKYTIEEHFRRIVAIDNLNDQNILIEIAMRDFDSEVRKVATDKVNDESTLAHIAKNDLCWHVRCVAVGKISDESVLVDVAENDSNDEVRRKAKERLTVIDF